MLEEEGMGLKLLRGAEVAEREQVWRRMVTVLETGLPMGVPVQKLTPRPLFSSG